MIGAKHHAVALVLRDIERSRCAWCSRYAPAVLEAVPDGSGHVTGEFAVCARATCMFAAAALKSDLGALVDAWSRRSRAARMLRRSGGAR